MNKKLTGIALGVCLIFVFSLSAMANDYLTSKFLRGYTTKDLYNILDEFETEVDAAIVADSTLYPLLDGTRPFTGAQDFQDDIQGDTIIENTSGAGVTIDSVILKDGGITIASTCGTHALEMTGTWGVGITGGAIVIGDYSNAIAFGEVTEHVVGLCVNLSGSTDDTSNFIPIHGKFTTTADCVTNAGAQAIYGRIDIKHNLSSSYAIRGAITMSGAPEVNQVYGMFSTMALAGCNLAETGQVAGLAIELTGSEDITTSGSYGKVSGIRIAWEHTNAMTVDTCGIYTSVKTGATLDSGYRMNAAGSLTSSFHSYNSGSAPTQALKIEGAHTNAFSFPAVGTAPVAEYTTEEAPTGKIKIQVGGATRYLAYWD